MLGGCGLRPCASRRRQCFLAGSPEPASDSSCASPLVRKATSSSSSPRLPLLSSGAASRRRSASDPARPPLSASSSSTDASPSFLRRSGAFASTPGSSPPLLQAGSLVLGRSSPPLSFLGPPPPPSPRRPDLRLPTRICRHCLGLLCISVAASACCSTPPTWLLGLSALEGDLDLDWGEETRM